jgi:hypothetical protein
MFTLDWWGSTYSENAGALGWKSAHMICLDNGYFALQPNNRILWENPAFIKKVEKPDYALTERIWKCEGGGTTTDEYFYKKEKQNAVLPSAYSGNNCVYCEECPCVCSEHEEVWL